MWFVFINVYAPNTGRERMFLFGVRVRLKHELSQVAPEETLASGGSDSPAKKGDLCELKY
jgi:hypothetical protein